VVAEDDAGKNKQKAKDKKTTKSYYLFGMRPVRWPVAGTTRTRPLSGHWTWAEPRFSGVRRSTGPKGRLKGGQAPGLIKQTLLVGIGFWMNVHPGFASSRVFHTTITQDIEEQYENHPDVIEKFSLPTAHTPAEMYLSRSKIHAEYTNSGKPQTIDTDALMLYAPKNQAELVIIYTTHFSSFSTIIAAADPMFILLAAKYHQPEKFGEYVARQNAFLNDHRNIAIVGLAPDPMDYVTENGANLWTSIRNLPGVFPCDPCHRTPDLGKWNISCDKDHHPSICQWIDTNLITLWNTISPHSHLATFAPFPTLEQLSKGRRATLASSVVSGLTDASPVADYFRKRESNLQLQNLPSTPTRNAWKSNLPIEDISYCFDATAFPNLPTLDKTKSTAMTAQATGSVFTSPVTAVSAITEDMVSSTVRSSITEYENRRKIADDASDARMNRLEQHAGDIDHQEKQIASQMQKVVVEELPASEARQHSHTARQDTKLIVWNP
jgi:hypothetical protein